MTMEADLAAAQAILDSQGTAEDIAKLMQRARQQAEAALLERCLDALGVMVCAECRDCDGESCDCLCYHHKEHKQVAIDALLALRDTEAP